MEMNAHAMFDWIDFPEGRARFVGLVRGADERGHEVFALKLDSGLLYGEIEPRFLANQNDFDVEIVSFGVKDECSFGEAPFDPREFLPRTHVDKVRALILRLIAAGAAMEDRPSFLRETENSHFMGRVLFRQGWVRLAAGEERA